MRLVVIQRSLTECGASECDCEASVMRSGPLGAVASWEKKYPDLLSNTSVFIVTQLRVSVHLRDHHQAVR
jgi:hypothetical protein